MRLSQDTARHLPASIQRPAYARDEQRVGIVHLGIGAFHRAHQAVFTDDAMDSGDRDWAILGVSLRSATVRDQMSPQGGLFTVTQRGSDGSSTRLIGAVRDVLVAPEDPGTVVDALASPDTRIVSLTVTEKGYFRRPDGSLDVDAVSAAGDRTIYHFLADALARRSHGGAPLTLLPCDNLSGNGQVLAALLSEWLETRDPAVARWFAQDCACASTMVDRIVPAVTATDLDTTEALLGMRDEAAVVTEPFSQWVIEDRFAAGRPNWEIAGAQFVSDVRPYETAKLRMLNGAHSALAYIGLARGHRYVHQAIGDPGIHALVERLMTHEAARSFSPLPDQDLQDYARQLLERFGNTALPHRLAQIAMDGSQKIGPRWLDSLAANARSGRTCPATLAGVGAWIVHVRGDSASVDDPMADELATIWQAAGSHGIVDALFGPQGLFAARWIATADDRTILSKHAAGG